MANLSDPKQAPKESNVAYLRRRLDVEKGNWPRIARESGVPYGTLEKVAQGDTENPRTNTVESLLAWFAARDEMHESLRKVSSSDERAA